MVKGILDIIQPPTKIKKTVYAQTYTRINTYYLYLLLILISITIQNDLDIENRDFLLYLKSFLLSLNLCFLKFEVLTLYKK